MITDINKVSYRDCWYHGDCDFSYTCHHCGYHINRENSNCPGCGFYLFDSKSDFDEWQKTTAYIAGMIGELRK